MAIKVVYFHAVTCCVGSSPLTTSRESTYLHTHIRQDDKKNINPSFPFYILFFTFLIYGFLSTLVPELAWCLLIWPPANIPCPEISLSSVFGTSGLAYWSVEVPSGPAQPDRGGAHIPYVVLLSSDRAITTFLSLGSDGKTSSEEGR